MTGGDRKVVELIRTHGPLTFDELKRHTSQLIIQHAYKRGHITMTAKRDRYTLGRNRKP